MTAVVSTVIPLQKNSVDAMPISARLEGCPEIPGYAPLAEIPFR